MWRTIRTRRARWRRILPVCRLARTLSRCSRCSRTRIWLGWRRRSIRLSIPGWRRASPRRAARLPRNWRKRCKMPACAAQSGLSLTLLKHCVMPITRQAKMIESRPSDRSTPWQKRWSQEGCISLDRESNRRDQSMAKQQTEEELNLKRKARRRLIGAVALTLAVVVILPMVLDSEPKLTGQDIELRIPAPDKVGEFVPGVAVSEVAGVSPFAASAVEAASSPLVVFAAAGVG